MPFDDDANRVHATHAVFVISVAAELAGMHPQTLRIYERKGLLEPSRTGGGSRRYSQLDIARLHRIAELTNAGLNLEGVRQVMALEEEVISLRAQLAMVQSQLHQAVEATHRQYRRDLVPLSNLPAVRSDGPRPR
jgi:MerR family transcriptional regulator, heat shock protein HspR